MRITTIISMVVIVSSKIYIGGLSSCTCFREKLLRPRKLPSAADGIWLVGRDRRCSSCALQRREPLAWSLLGGQHQSRGRVHAVDHRRRDQDRGAALLCRLVDDVHGTQLQGGGMIGIDLGGLDKLPRDLGFLPPQLTARPVLGS